ncbi:filamentous hemagglutinin family protein [Cupriavidus basilensis]
MTLSSDVPGTGAGIATLNPIPEVPAGDVDLNAPLGTIDAGEAGIRVSGSVSLAQRLRVVNAANIAVKGQATGLPVMAAVNVSALNNASTAASQASGSGAGRVAARARDGAPGHAIGLHGAGARVRQRAGAEAMARCRQRRRPVASPGPPDMTGRTQCRSSAMARPSMPGPGRS